MNFLAGLPVVYLASLQIILFNHKILSYGFHASSTPLRFQCT